jgi:hypothetical protein
MYFCTAKIIESRRDRRHKQELPKQIRPTATQGQTAQPILQFSERSQRDWHFRLGERKVRFLSGERLG